VIVESQLQKGHILIIFDGVSEIRGSFQTRSGLTDIPHFVRNHPDTPFIFTSRSNLTSSLAQSLGDATQITIQDVNEKTERGFLSQYLKRGSQKVDSLIEEIKIRYPILPRIPLMLRLVATVYDRTDSVPKDRLMLFAAYVEQLMRPEATGIEEPAGLNFAIRHLVRETYLKSGGDRGFTLEKGVEALEQISARLASYDIELSPNKLLSLLTRTGLYIRNAENLRFFHDSFEGYFAGRALESDFRNKKYELVMNVFDNRRLAEAFPFYLRPKSKAPTFSAASLRIEGSTC
jgi:hypothetical protein